jgi:hypothetical protein
VDAAEEDHLEVGGADRCVVDVVRPDGEVPCP